jgi:GNAT superfamily N-acetyltransferase
VRRLLHGEDAVRRLRLRLNVTARAEATIGHPLVRAADLAGVDALAVSAAVEAYLRQTESEKAQQEGSDPDPAAPLPDRYRREVDDPSAAYAGCRVLVAEIDGRVVGVVVLSVPDRVAEIKRLWAVPEVRGRGVGSALLDAALAAAIDAGAAEVRLSVWDWRVGAVRLYASRGFAPVPFWDDRERLVCMVRPTARTAAPGL